MRDNLTEVQRRALYDSMQAWRVPEMDDRNSYQKMKERFIRWVVRDALINLGANKHTAHHHARYNDGCPRHRLESALSRMRS